MTLEPAPAVGWLFVVLGTAQVAGYRPIPASSDTPVASLAAGDFDGDGKADLAVGFSTLAQVSIYRADNPTLLNAVVLSGSGPRYVAAGDFDRDGLTDLAVATSGNVSVLLGTGSSGFGAATNFSVGSAPISVAVGDFNGDGKPDLAVANSGSNNVSILLGTGGGSFGPATDFSVGSSPYSVAVGDFNSDGKPDLAVANSDSYNVSILLNTCVASAVTATRTSTPTATAITASCATPSFGAAANFSAGSNPSSVTVGDFNGDGKPDLAVANSSTGNVSILLNTCVASAVTATPTATATLTPTITPTLTATTDGSCSSATPGTASTDSDHATLLSLPGCFYGHFNGVGARGWFQFTVPQPGTLSIDTLDSGAPGNANVDTRLFLYRRLVSNELQPLAFNDDCPCGGVLSQIITSPTDLSRAMAARPTRCRKAFIFRGTTRKTTGGSSCVSLPSAMRARSTPGSSGMKLTFQMAIGAPGTARLTIMSS
ncbi:MAG: VCBS repeat-containing protein [Chloroflexi bacterium]|nr:VCBS repeat-containing protein [Chloroflexota bacterium]